MIGPGPQSPRVAEIEAEVERLTTGPDRETALQMMGLDMLGWEELVQAALPAAADMALEKGGSPGDLLMTGFLTGLVAGVAGARTRDDS